MTTLTVAFRNTANAPKRGEKLGFRTIKSDRDVKYHKHVRLPRQRMQTVRSIGEYHASEAHATSAFSLE
jgi:hypothetical protein